MKVWRLTDQVMMRGDFHRRPDKLRELQNLEVSAVVCLLRRTDPELERSAEIEYVNFPLANGRVVPVETAYRAADFVARRARQGRKVLVHCIGAQDRSALVVGLALRTLFGISGEEAFRRVRAVKATTFYNPEFERYLRRQP